MHDAKRQATQRAHFQCPLVQAGHAVCRACMLQDSPEVPETTCKCMQRWVEAPWLPSAKEVSSSRCLLKVASECCAFGRMPRPSEDYLNHQTQRKACGNAQVRPELQHARNIKDNLREKHVAMHRRDLSFIAHTSNTVIKVSRLLLTPPSHDRCRESACSLPQAGPLRGAEVK